MFETFLKPFFPLIILCLGLTLSDSVSAENTQIPQSTEPTLEDKTLSMPPEIRDGQFFTVNIENDLFGNGADQNYTNGVRFSYHNSDLTIPFWARKIGEIYPGFRINDTTALTYSFGQNLYTPRDITTTIPNPSDRPYAAWLYGSAGLSTITDNHKDSMEISLGMVGPAALGKITQNFVHNHVSPGSKDPQGWDSQLDNEPGIILSWNREYQNLWTKNWDEKLHLSLSPFYGTSLGNVYTLAQIGIGFRLAPYQERYADLPARVRPAIPGTGAFTKPVDKWSWGFFGGVTGYAVARNIFLDGNTFESSPSVDKKPFVYDASIGFDTIYTNTRLSYTLTHRSKEFDGQDEDSVFGSLSLTRRF